MDQKLLLKQKDYELLATKRQLIPKHSFHDPLINPPKYKTKKTKNKQALPIQSSANTLKNNILDRKVQKPVQVQSVALRNSLPIEEIDMKMESTPWKTILNLFQKAYDYRQQPKDLQVANPFGSQGVKADIEFRASQSYSPAATNVRDPKATISIATYIKILENMKHELRVKWSQNDKVGSLQISIQACKLLHDTSNAKFHALKFAYVMEILEQFGINVFKRIKSLSFPNYSQQKINEMSIKDLEGKNIPESAQQISRNWLLKISSIRQLVPRTIVETTLLRLHFFLDNGVKARKVLYRLSRSNRCFGQYINCIFFCTFLVRIAKEVLPHDKDYILDILDDVFFYIKQGQTRFCRQDISEDDFYIILEPFFISSFECLAQNLQKDKFKRFCNILPQNPHPVILSNFINSFSSSLLATYAVDLVKMLQRLKGQHKFVIYKRLFERLSAVTFNNSQDFIMFSWNDLADIENIELLMDILGPFSNLMFRNLPKYQVNKFYGLILEKFSDLFDNVLNLKSSIFKAFSNFLTTILQNIDDVSDILALQPFLQIISYFPATQKVEVSFNIVNAFLERQGGKITDPVAVHLIMGLMKSVPDDKVEHLAIKLLDRIDFEKDLEQTLSFFGEMRASFGYIEKLTVSMIYKAAGLTFKARKLSKGRMTNKLISFLQATISFCFITVPVLQNSNLELKLYIYLSQVALSNNLISQATSLIKTCITKLAQVQPETDHQIYEIYYRIICFLIVMPDDPENDYLFLFNGLFHAFKMAKFKTSYEHILKLQFYTKCIVYLSCQAQERLPFHLEGVTSNDALFKSIDFRRALVEKIMQIADLIEEAIGKVSQLKEGKIDTYLITHLTEVVMTLLTTFETGSRLAIIIKSIIKIIERSKDRCYKTELKTVQESIRACLKGLNTKLQENEINLKISL